MSRSGTYRLSAILAAVCLVFIGSADAQTSDPPAIPCASHSNTTCEDCLKNVTACVEYPVRSLLPRPALCPLADARWGLCWVNFQSLIISMSVLVGAILIAILVCCCCCCKCERIGGAASRPETLQYQATRGDPGKYSTMSEEKPKEGVKTENDHINLKVAGQDGSVVQFKIKRHTPLSKLMKAYCERQGLAIRQIRFRFDGQPINETDTPAQLEMEDEDTIDVFQQQTGGSFS
ncbi:unnamed protein product [Merluccius merluccius]